MVSCADQGEPVAILCDTCRVVGKGGGSKP